MIRALSDILLLSDLDGTLFDEPHGAPCRVSLQNREAVRRFVSEGGHFAIATGRAHPIALGLTGELAINFPSVFVNGGYVYDVQKGEISCQSFVDTLGKEDVRRAIERFDGIEAAVYYNDYGQFPLTDGGNPKILAEEVHGDHCFMDIESGIYKYMFFTLPERQRELFEYIGGALGDSVDVVVSAPTLLELLPKGVSKAHGIRRLMESTGWDAENVVAVGDYYNDIEMLDMAGTAVCMGNAPDEVKRHADLTVKSCSEHGVADLIERLEKMYL